MSQFIDIHNLSFYLMITNHLIVKIAPIKICASFYQFEFDDLLNIIILWLRIFFFSFIFLSRHFICVPFLNSWFVRHYRFISVLPLLNLQTIFIKQSVIGWQSTRHHKLTAKAVRNSNIKIGLL